MIFDGERPEIRLSRISGENIIYSAMRRHDGLPEFFLQRFPAVRQHPDQTGIIGFVFIFLEIFNLKFAKLVHALSPRARLGRPRMLTFMNIC